MGNIKSDIGWFLGILVLLGIAWFSTGGPERSASVGGPFIEPPPPLGSGRTYGTQIGEPSGGGVGSFGTTDSALKVTLRSGNARYEKSSNKEYVTIEVSRGNSVPVNITGWRLVDKAGHSATIQTGQKVLRLDGSYEPAVPLMLEPGARATVVTGWPPGSMPVSARVNFQTTLCTGYLNEGYGQLLYPRLPEQCPDPEKEAGINSLSETCYRFVRSLRRCHEPEFKRRDGVDYTDNNPNLDNRCRQFLAAHYNYNACVQIHRQDPDFFGTEWRIYLKQDRELWTERQETVSLYDNQNKLVDQISW